MSPEALPPVARAPWRQSWGALAVTVTARTILGVLALLLLVSVVPTFFGWQSTVVMSGSMAPAVAPGDIALVRPVDAAELAPGDVLLVDDPAAPGQLLLHRLVAVEPGGLRLRGDANPDADSALVAPSAVHGVGALRLPMLGRPVVWAAEDRTAPLIASAAALVALLALALLHRPADGERRGSTPRPKRPARRLVPLVAAATALVVLPGMTGTGAVFTATTESPRVELTMARYWACPEAAAGAGATHSFRLQEALGPTAANSGTAGAPGNGTYAGGVTYAAGGPACGGSNDRAVALDGITGSIWTTQLVTNPQTFTAQIWFSTGTWSGGKLFGFGNGASGATSSSYDRHIYMTNAGQLVFGVYDGTTRTVTSPRAYNDGRWHLATATFSAGTGISLHVDGQLVARDATATIAENYTGYWRIGHDNLTGWPGAPTSAHFNGSLAHVSVFPTVLPAAEIADHFLAGT